MISGIYTITSPSGNFYVGSSIVFGLRWADHLKQLRRGDHHNPQLQRAFNKYGESGLVFKKLLICKPEDLLFYEQRAIDILKPRYNANPIATSNLGRKFGPRSTEAKLKTSIALKGRKRNPTPEQALALFERTAKHVQCIETGQIFRTGKAAGKWCIAQGLTNNKTPHVKICTAIKTGKVVFLHHWKFPDVN